MPYSTVTEKWQTTIPKVIRLLLGIRPSDKIVYVIDNGKVTLDTVSGDILDIRGAVKGQKGEVDFKSLRQKAKNHAARRAAK
jgi:AbrB family looped-hinge helix DNA binding protein